VHFIVKREGEDSDIFYLDKDKPLVITDKSEREREREREMSSMMVFKDISGRQGKDGKSVTEEMTQKDTEEGYTDNNTRKHVAKKR
jgi:hypothetical protein